MTKKVQQIKASSMADISFLFPVADFLPGDHLYGCEPGAGSPSACSYSSRSEGRGQGYQQAQPNDGEDKLLQPTDGARPVDGCEATPREGQRVHQE